MSGVPSGISLRSSLQTLKGIFSSPQMIHRRNFLRENKLNVKSRKKQAEQPTKMAGKRKNAQNPKSAQGPVKRTDSQQQGNGTKNNQLKPTKSFCSKLIQTEDITDREFLYQALQKCTGGDGEHQQDYAEQFTDRYGGPVEQLDLGDGDGARAVNGYNYYDEQEEMQQPQRQESVRSYRSHQSSQHNPMPSMSTSRSQMTLSNGQMGGNALSHQEEALSNRFDNLSLHQPEEEPDLPVETGRSRMTLASKQSSSSLNKKQSSSSVHKIGSRTDVRLPRYLEREKREKQEELLRQQQHDPNCPEGYYLLTEQERLSSLANANKQFKSLVSELNHMPMTTKTLRIQARKNEIERELCSLENDIRLFSKPKVYVKQEA